MINGIDVTYKVYLTKINKQNQFIYSDRCVFYEYKPYKEFVHSDNNGESINILVTGVHKGMYFIDIIAEEMYPISLYKIYQRKEVNITLNNGFELKVNILKINSCLLLLFIVLGWTILYWGTKKRVK